MHRRKYKSKKCNKEKKQTTLKNIQKARNQVKRIVKEKSWKDFGEKRQKRAKRTKSYFTKQLL